MDPVIVAQVHLLVVRFGYSYAVVVVGGGGGGRNRK